jgi:hypothetical protein
MPKASSTRVGWRKLREAQLLSDGGGQRGQPALQLSINTVELVVAQIVSGQPDLHLGVPPAQSCRLPLGFFGQSQGVPTLLQGAAGQRHSTRSSPAGWPRSQTGATKALVIWRLPHGPH